MDRRTFIASGTAMSAAAMAAGIASLASADGYRSDVAGQMRPPGAVLAEHLKGLETWARELRRQVEASPSAPLHPSVLPAIAPWFGSILGTMAEMQGWTHAS